MNIVMDTLEAAELNIGPDNSRAVRTGVVTDIPAQARSDPYVLCRAMFEANGPAFGEPHPYAPALRLRRIVARPAAGTNDVFLQYHYEGPPHMSGSWQSLLVIDDGTTMATEMEEVDQFGKVIQAQYRHLVEEGDDELSVVKTGAIPVLRPRRRLTVSGLVYSRTAPSAWARSAQGQVNDAPWPTGSLWSEDAPDPRGYWLATSIDASTDWYYRHSQVFEPKLAPYRIRCTFESKIYRDWSHYVIYRNHRGNVPKEMGGDALAAQIRGLMDKPYAPGQDTSVNGMTKIGAYKVCSFPAVFGF